MATEWLEARNPLTGEKDHRFPVADRAAVAEACAAVRAAQPAWAALGREGRSAALVALGEAFKAEAPALFAALAADTGRQRITHIELEAMQGFIGLDLMNAAKVL
ncbi:MAG: aldehyde dehydrogenase family protein, partial [Gammaproteobacteria bacterium]|nr:aldehyde dehydrogenase family protein [Gammaproteobacteria bacterium]